MCARRCGAPACRRSRAAGTLVRAGGKPTARLTRLVDAVRAVIAEAIEAGGSSLRDYVQADGELGLFQHRFAVYDREGKPCLKPGCTRHDPAHRPVRPLDLLLPDLPALTSKWTDEPARRFARQILDAAAASSLYEAQLCRGLPAAVVVCAIACLTSMRPGS